MDVILKQEIINKLSHRGIMAYVAVTMAGDMDTTTAVLAGFVRVQTAVMLEGLKELAEGYPLVVSQEKKGKWHCGDPANVGMVLVAENTTTRYALFVDDLKKYWDFINNGISPARLPPEYIRIPFSMGAKDGAAIRGFLRDHPSWTEVHWREALRNRAKSPVSKSAPIYTWVGKLSEFAAGPLNEYNKPQEGTGKHGQAITTEQSNRAAREAALGRRAEG